ncbi:MAG: ABC transporter permease [Anaerolineae bacterium]|jgi:NitT/TauT family transport system permease protein|nr:ABC transporter permease [Anaerolineae bacterium]
MDDQLGTGSAPTYRASKRALPQELRRAPFYLLSVAFLFLVWQVAVVLTAESARRFLVPTPSAVATTLLRLLGDGTIARHAGTTLLEMALGLGLGMTVALILGYGVAHSRPVAYILEPVIVVSQAVPIVALAPLLTVWFGPGLASKVVVCALTVFFPILVSVTTGLRNIDPRQTDMFRMLEATRMQVLRHLEIPGVLASFLSGLKVGGTLAAIGAVVGEFVASSKGLGYLVKQGQNLYDLPRMFAAILTLMAIAVAIYGALTLLERLLLRWKRAGV